MLPVSTFVQANLGMETFIFLSVFIMTHRCFQIMDSKNGNVLNVCDIFRLLIRKFYRLAVPYYLMWVIMWCVTSRAGDGPIWSNTNVTYGTCKDDWLYTLLFVGNLFPNEMEPYAGCFQQAFALQLDMQIALFVPFLAIIAYKVPFVAILLSLGLIFANAVVTIYYVDKYDLKAGFMAVENFNLLTGIIGKPWTKLQNIGQGIIFALIYR